MPGHYENKKKKKRKATPFDGVAAHGMSNAFKKLTAPKPIKPPKPPKPTKPPQPVKPAKPPQPVKPARQKNNRTGEDFLDMERKRQKKK